MARRRFSVVIRTHTRRPPGAAHGKKLDRRELVRAERRRRRAARVLHHRVAR